MKSRVFLFLITVLLMAACRQAQVPANYKQLQKLPQIYPDYVGVTVPVNIAPLNFELLIAADDAVARFSADGKEIVCSGLKIRPDIDEWKSLLTTAVGKSICVEVFAEKDGQWMRFTPYYIYVSPDSIDPWLSYRMISPSYVSYEELTINQRCLESFDEQVIVDNMLCSTEAGGQCVNCHSYQQWNPERMQFHARQTHGGTVITYDGQVEKVDMRHDSLLSAGVYPAWHPQLKLIAYSTNKTMQSFHTADLNKIEVLDSESDLIIYDVERHEIRTIEDRPNELEIFPYWSPDGRWLYFCSAHFEYQADSVDAAEITLRAKELKYNIYRKAFNPSNLQFGERELVFAADTLSTFNSQLSTGMSATFPRISPDGRWLLFTMGEWGCFHIWHHDADMWMMDLSALLKNKEQRIMKNEEGIMNAWPLEEANSDDTESYHSWSSNGRWVVFSSRRYDGVFTRPFFVHIDKDGHATKPFELPTENPDYHRQLLKSYNVPELMRGPVTLSPQQFATQLKTEGIRATYKSR
jgi:hypothetical protein